MVLSNHQSNPEKIWQTFWQKMYPATSEDQELHALQEAMVKSPQCRPIQHSLLLKGLNGQELLRAVKKHQGSVSSPLQLLNWTPTKTLPRNESCPIAKRFRKTFDRTSLQSCFSEDIPYIATSQWHHECLLPRRVASAAWEEPHHGCPSDRTVVSGTRTTNPCQQPIGSVLQQQHLSC